MDELLGEAAGAELAALEEEGLGGGGDDELGGAAADIDDEGRLIAEVDGLADRKVDEAGFLLGVDDLDGQPQVQLEEFDEVGAVGAFADGAGGVGQDDVAVEAAGDALVAAEDLVGVDHGAAGKPVADEGGGAKLGELLLGAEDAEGELVGDFDDDHVHGVGADVDGGDAQAVGRAALRSGGGALGPRRGAAVAPGGAGMNVGRGSGASAGDHGVIMCMIDDKVYMIGDKAR